MVRRAHIRTVHTACAVAVRLLRIRTCNALQTVVTHMCVSNQHTRVTTIRTAIRRRRQPTKRIVRMRSRWAAHTCRAVHTVQAVRGTECTSNARHSPRCLRHIRCMCCRLRCRGSAQDPRKLCMCSHRSQQSAGSQRGTPSKPRRPHCTSQHMPGTPPAEHPAPRQRCTGCTCCHPCCSDQPGTPRSRQHPHSAADLGRTSRKTTSCPALGDRCCGDACRSGTQCSASHQH